MSQLIIHSLTKKYGNNVIFENVSLELTSSNINFLIGGNGTGKSTFIKCLLDEIKYDGRIEKENLVFSYSPEKIILPDYITINNFLLLLQVDKKITINDKEKLIDYYLALFNIEKYKNIVMCKLSKGTRQKVILIQALMNKADIYIFDEPLSGLDDISRKHFIEEVKKLKLQSKLIIISTHHLKEYRFKEKKVLRFPLKGDLICGL